MKESLKKQLEEIKSQLDPIKTIFYTSWDQVPLDAESSSIIHVVLDLGDTNDQRMRKE